MESFTDLPIEIKNIILEELLQNLPRVRYPLTSYALVCKEWNYFFEKIIFGQLKLEHSHLAKATQLPDNRKSLVKKIHFHIELRPFKAMDFLPHGFRGKAKTINTRREEDRKLLSLAIPALLFTLSTWDKGQGNCISLELSAHPSEYGFGHFRDLSDRQLLPSLQDDWRAWDVLQRILKGRRNRNSFLSFQMRENATDRKLLAFQMRKNANDGNLEIDSEQRLLFAPVVKHLAILRKTRRHILPATIQIIVSCLPGLESIHYEPWQRDLYQFGNITDSYYQTFVAKCIPAGVSKVILFEDENEKYAYNRPSQVAAHERRNPLPSIAIALVKQSIYLEHLSASFLVKATDFFDCCLVRENKDLIWKNLRTLALTSTVLVANSAAGEIDRLLWRTAAVVPRMPRLERLILWFGKKGTAAAFEYHESRHEAKISWNGTFGVKFQASVIGAWKKIAFDRRRYLWAHYPVVLDGRLIKCHGDAIKVLGLETAGIVDSGSLEQMCEEWDIYDDSP